MDLRNFGKRLEQGLELRPAPVVDDHKGGHIGCGESANQVHEPVVGSICWDHDGEFHGNRIERPQSGLGDSPVLKAVRTV